MSAHPYYSNMLAKCRRVYEQKRKDYGSSWRLFRPSSVTDQMLIKIKRIRTLEETKTSAVGEDVFSDYLALVNYGAMAVVQKRLGSASNFVIDSEEAYQSYLSVTEEAESLMVLKNQDYGEAWRDLRIESITDLIFVKLYRIIAIEKNEGKTEGSEGVESNYLDIMNYAIFAMILISETKECEQNVPKE